MNESNNRFRNMENSERNDEISLVHIFSILKESILTIASITIIFAIVGTLYILRQPEIFRAEALVTPVENASNVSSSFGSQFSGLANLAGINTTQSGASTATHIAILQSRTLLEGFIKDNLLTPYLFLDQWDKQNSKWKNGEAPKMRSAVKKLQGMILVEEQKPMRIIAIEWEDPVLAAEWCNQLVIYLNNHIRQQKIEEAKKSIYFLEEQLQLTSLVKSKSILFSLIEEQTKNITLANVRDEYAFKFIDRAYVPEQKVRPLRLQTMVFSTIVGFIISLLFVFFTAFLRQFNLISKD